jgi:glucose-6-phosphate isomerase
VTITDPKDGELRRLTRAQGWASFEVPPNIGGRYSVLTAVGLVPCALAGVAPKALLEGARDMRASFERSTKDLSQNAAAAFALALWEWDANQRHSIHVLMPYWSSLRLFADWYVQLFAESLGKMRRSGDKAVGPTPFAALGTSDQHSILQLLREGPSDKVVGFMGVDDSQSAKIGKPPLAVEGYDYLFGHSFGNVSQKALEATQASLSNGKVPTYRIQIPALSARALGALFLFFETACAVSAELYGVDGFNQPGVEEAKRLLKKSLTH